MKTVRKQKAATVYTVPFENRTPEQLRDVYLKLSQRGYSHVHYESKHAYGPFYSGWFVFGR